MERTLYLNDTAGLLVKKDGPSLWIVEKGRAGRRVPLRLIGEVVVRGNVRLDAGAITMLAENGVPVTFIGRGKGSITTALMRDMPPTVFMAKVERLRRSGGGRARVVDMMESMRSNHQRRLLKELFPPRAEVIESRGLRESDYRTWLHTLIPSCAGRKGAEAIKGVLEGLFHECALKKVIDSGLDPHGGFIHLHSDFGFVKDICHVIEAERDRQLVRFFKSPVLDRHMVMKKGGPVITGEGMRNIAVRFENRKGALLGMMDSVLVSFFEVLRGSWR